MIKFAPKPIRDMSVIENASSSNTTSIAKTSKSINLTTADQIAVRALRQQLSKNDSNNLLSFGMGIQDEFAKMADELLEHTRAQDISFVGEHLTNVVVKAKGINISTMNGNKSRIPVLGKYLDQMRNSRDRITSRFDTVSVQIEQSIGEVDKFCVGISARLKTLEDLFQANVREYKQLNLHIIAAKMAHEEISAETEAFIEVLPDNADPIDVQQIADAKRYLTNLSMTISNLERQSMAAVHFGPQVRMVQQEGLQLLDKFGMIKKFTIPSWKKNFALALTIDEHTRGAALANMIDDANNQFARDAATAQKQTSIAIAKSNQRGVFDLETIEHVQSEIITGMDELVKIVSDGDKERKAISNRLAEMKQELQLKLKIA